ncbi:MAG: thiol reductant ABC exporter subunit CydC [Anaerolineae bacterium CG_4_9_14_3_um_filter_57_17]|nr:thiol reductant ABC exporter subunit CydC [bacterium]NCT21218.1 thiol reductant ABC exporter subunit CydC [bacterium]OIO84248.1 MAG: thiol reductant ABC exporter subunit CydC [Anaerolineae bacterium CG2_30_57_67]PJB68594.1 MAG: thiol reductant ABC exporter subunit CydC [Anaerolineae bacterium CG_4_9_14_3_um_filter_57_17]
MLRLLSFLRPYWSQVLLSVLLGALTIAASIGLMSTSAWLISMAALHPSVADLGVSVVGVRFFGISRALFRYAERLVSHSLTFRVLARLHVWFYQAIEPLAPARLTSVRSGDLLNRVMADVETLDNLYVRVLAPPLVAVVIILGMGIFMGLIAPQLGIAIVGFLLAVGLGLTLLSLRLNRAPGQILVNQRARLRADWVDAVQGLPDLLAFGQEKVWERRIQARAADFSATQTRMAHFGAAQSALNSLLTGLGVLTMLVLAIPLVASGQLHGVMLAVVVLGSMAAFEAVQNLPQAAQLLEANLQSARRLFAVADQPPAVAEPLTALARPLGAELSIRNLSFSYGESPVLRGLSFDLPAGRKIAIVGPSGAGKSTLANVLLRFWDYAEGEILLDGQALRAYRAVDARRMFSVVTQNTYLFNASLRENLQLARPAASSAELERVCRQVELGAWLTTLPQGLETLVGERGAQISGGERQRLAIARALLKDAPIFLFDEPTANLDPATERRLVETLHTVSAGKSLLWSTHRLVGLERMDEILVLEAGRIVERGAHAALLAQNGLYARLWNLQNRALTE